LIISNAVLYFSIDPRQELLVLLRERERESGRWWVGRATIPHQNRRQMMMDTNDPSHQGSHAFPLSWNPRAIYSVSSTPLCICIEYSIATISYEMGNHIIFACFTLRFELKKWGQLSFVFKSWTRNAIEGKKIKINS